MTTSISCSQCQSQTPKDPLQTKLQVCSKCKKIHYCGIECQKIAWKSHKLICNQLKMQRETEKMIEELRKQCLILQPSVDLLYRLTDQAINNPSRDLTHSIKEAKQIQKESSKQGKRIQKRMTKFKSMEKDRS